MIILPPRCHTVVASLHPAFAMHGMPQFKPFIRQALRRAQRWSCSAEPPKRPTDLRLDPTPDELTEYLRGVQRIVVDVETPEDRPTEIIICGVARGDGGAMVFPWQGEFIEVMRDALAVSRRVVIGHNFAYDYRALRAYGLEINGFIFDTIQAGALLWPTFREAKNRRWSALSTYATRICDDAPFWKNAEDPTAQAFYHAAFPQVPEWLYPRLYCGLDCIYTDEVESGIVEHLKHEGMYETYVDYVAPAGRVLMELEERGFALDEAAREEMKAAAQAKLAELEEKTRDFADARHGQRLARIREAIEGLEEKVAFAVPDEPRCGAHPSYAGLTKREKCEGCKHVWWVMEPVRARVKDLKGRIRQGRTLLDRLGSHFKIDNNDHWRWLLFDPQGLGLKAVEVTTKRRDPKVDDGVLVALQVQHPDLDVLRWRVQIQGLLHRLNGILDMPLGLDGRAHFAYSQHRTENMRIASGMDAEEDDKRRDSPGNAQNVKHEDRRLFIPSDPEGMLLVKFDWKQVELYRTAWLAEDWDLLEAIWGGADIHSLNAEAIYGIEAAKAREHMVRFEGGWKSARYAAKRSTHGWDYYMREKLTAKLYGISLEAARAARAGYFRRWRRIQPWQEGQIQRASRDGFIRNSFGYRLPFAAFEKNRRTGVWEIADKAVAVAFEPASDVAFMCKAVLPGLAALKEGTLLNTEHDSFTFETRRGSVDALVHAALPILRREWPVFGERRGRMFAAGVDVEVGENWGKYHKHGTKCGAACEEEENEAGLREWMVGREAGT